jgi:hypothetical protein
MKSMLHPTWTHVGKLVGRLMIETLHCTKTMVRIPLAVAAVGFKERWHGEDGDDRDHRDRGDRREVEGGSDDDRGYRREERGDGDRDGDRGRGRERDDGREHRHEHQHEHEHEHERKHACACGSKRSCACGCRIPETECETGCVAEIELGAMTGQTVSAVVRVVSRANTARHYAFSSTPFVSGTASAQFTFAPASLDLAPGTSGFTTASLAIPITFTKGEYEAKIIVRGAYEQCVDVELEVGCEEMRSATADVVQLDAPFRIRAHHWYDHFQCVEPCGPVHRDAAGTPGAGNAADAAGVPKATASATK